MSQSDYIKHKRVATALITQMDMPSVLESGNYSSFLGYNIENTVMNTNPTLNQLIPSTNQIIFSMKLKTTQCPTFLACIHTNTRPNRKSIVIRNNIALPYVTPLTPLTDKQLSKYIDISIQGSRLCQCTNI